MGFWVKHILAAVVLLFLAVLVLFNPHWLEPTPVQQPTAIIKKSASLEFTNFYEQLRYSLDASADRAKEFVIQLTDTSSTLEETLTAVGKAIAPDFEFPVLVYFCPAQRAAVVTDKQNLFLEQNCRHLNPEPVKKRKIPAAN